MNLEERILILVPTVFFFITVAWDYLFQQLMFSELREVDSQHYQKIRRLIRPHLGQVTYSDAIFLFMVNGVLWILQLYRIGLGVLVIFTGVVVAVTGLLSSFMWRYKNGESVSRWAMVAVLVVAAVEFILFIFIP